MVLPSIKPGARALLAGRTGSGKTTVACWLMERSPQHWVIFNPKHTEGYKRLPDAIIFKKFDGPKLLRAISRYKYVLLNFSHEEASAEFQDAVLEWLHSKTKNIGVCVDELYTFHTAAGRAGSGLIGWLTRGRELRQSFIGLTQRPVWISLFLTSEADYIGSLDLNRKNDRKSMVEMTGRANFLDRLTGYEWLWYTVDSDDIRLYGPVPLS